MAIFNLDHFGLCRRVLLVGLALGLFTFLAFIEFIATTEQLKFIGAHNLDKVAHLSGGLFLALLFDAVSRPRGASLASWTSRLKASFAGWAGRPLGLAWLLTLIGVAAVTWEGYEFFFDADTAYFYHYFPGLWRLDAAGDIVAAFLGGYGYWAFFRSRQQN